MPCPDYPFESAEALPSEQSFSLRPLYMYRELQRHPPRSRQAPPAVSQVPGLRVFCVLSHSIG